MNFSTKQFKAVDLNSPFFDSLKKDYAEFAQWFSKKAEESAYVFETDAGEIDGFLYLKPEEGPVLDVCPPLPNAHRLKVGTFKVNPHGTRLGERFVKKIFDHAVTQGVDEIYLTIFPQQEALIELLRRYGFTSVGQKKTKNGCELVLLKSLRHLSGDAITDYPLVKLTNAKSYLLAIRPEWHTRLLPDSILLTEELDIVKDVSHTNSIHKVYLTKMDGVPNLRRGDVLLIYRMSDNKAPAHYRSVATSICVVEEFRNINTFSTKEDFLEYCRPYSIFTEIELANFWKTKRYPYLIRFTYNIALTKRVTRGVMIEDTGLDATRYWGFLPLTPDQLLDIARKGEINESLIIH